MPTRYTRFGEYFMQGLARALSEGTLIDVPHVGKCPIVGQIEPRMHHSNWSMQVDIGFPESYSRMTVGLYTFGSCLMQDTEQIPLPQPTYEDEADKIYPKEHQEAWFKLLGALEERLEREGYTVGASDDSDIYLITDYMPSDGVSASVLKPSVLAPKLIELCQLVVREHTGWHFWIRLAIEFADERHKGHAESIRVREDRVVYDLNLPRLQREFGTELGLTSGASGAT